MKRREAQPRHATKRGSNEFTAGVLCHPAQPFQRKPQLVDAGAGRYVHCRDGVFTHQPIALQSVQLLEYFDGRHQLIVKIVTSLTARPS